MPIKNESAKMIYLPLLTQLTRKETPRPPGMNLFLQKMKSILLLAAIVLLAAAAFSTAGCNAKDAIAAHLARGENYLAERKFSEAALEFRSAVELDKNSAPAHFGLARAFEGQMRFAETIEELRRAADADKNHIAARVKLGNYLLVAEPPLVEETERLVREIFESDAKNVEGHVLQASLLAAQKKPEAEILTILEKAIALDPNRVESYLSLARFLMSRERRADAERTFARALKVNANSPTAHVEFARFLNATDRGAEAEQHFRRAVELAPRDRETLETLAAYYLARQQFDRAEAVYKSIVSLYPDKPEERAALADFYAAIDRSADAIRVYQEILTQKPELVRARARLGEMFLQRGEIENADAQVAEILSRNNRDSQGLLLRARVRLRRNETEGAIKDLQEILKLEPSSRLALYFMADAQLRAGEIEQARNFVGDLQRFHPDFLFAKLLNAQISFASGEPETAFRQADDLLKKLEKAAPDRNTSAANLAELKISGLAARGMANLQVGKTADARADFAFAQKLAPNSASVYQNLAAIALRERKSDEAVGFYQKALMIEPHNFDALSGLVRAETARRNFAAAHAAIDRAGDNGNPKIEAAHFYLKSQILAAEGNEAASESALQKSIASNPDYLPAYIAYAALLTARRDSEAAIEKYREILRRNERDSGVYTLVGMLEESRGNLGAAIENYRQALQINPDAPVAANNLAWIYAESGNGSLDEAAALAQTIVDKYPAEAAYADTLGWIFYKKGLTEPAVAHLRRAVALDEKAAAQAGRAPNPAFRARLVTIATRGSARAAAQN
jgi:tetratricopeptide (TPR) repeat protein